MKDDKAKFFAQYWGQTVNPNGFLIEDIIEDCERFCLILTPLSQITDEHAIELGWESASEYLKWNNTCTQTFWSVKEIDFIRSKGYAIDWLNYSVEKQIELGWIKFDDKAK